MRVPVLIVDDNEADRYLLSRQLAETELVGRIFEAQDGDEALSFFLEREHKAMEFPDDYPPKFVFLDINMPRLDGYEFLAEFDKIRGTNELESVVIMMFSSSEQLEDRKRAMAFDFVSDYFVKGQFSSEQLASRISRHI